MSHLEDDLFGSDDTRRGRRGRSRRSARAQGSAETDGRERARSRRRGGCAFLVMILAVAVLVAGAAFSISGIRDMLPGGGPDNSDYAGPGSGSVEVTVPEGASGADIGAVLLEAGVVKSSGAFTNVANSDQGRAAAIQPGVYELKSEMRASDAFEMLTDPANRIANGVLLNEGLWRSEIFQRLAEGTGNEVADYEAAAKSSDLDLPAEADGDVEGWLFPATYEFPEDATPVQQLNTMIAKTVEELESAGVEKADWHRTLTVASIVEGEAGEADRAKVARVVENRLEDTDGGTVGRLQMDSTVHYIFQERGRAGTTDQMRASRDPYNTYRHAGLPPGPINNPGAAAIEAAADPEPGDWLYFVTVDPDTGETKFSTTMEQHETYVKEFQAWCREHTDRC